ncbi:MAG: hypothetical protein AAFU03_08640, partial [Bacteroidota bacterium]
MKTMLFILSTFLFCSALNAQHWRHHVSFDGFIANFTEELELNTDQLIALKEISDYTQNQLANLHSEELDESAKRLRRIALIQEQRKAIKELLTPEQLTQAISIKDRYQDLCRQVDRSGLREALTTHYQENILPVKLVARQAIE